MQKTERNAKKCRRQTAADFFYGFAFVLLLSLLLVIVVSCYCSLTHTHTHTHWLSGSSITGKRNKLNNFNFFALLLLSLSPPQLGAPPLTFVFLICFGTFRKFTVREINTPERAARKLRQIRSCAVISVRCCCCFCYFLRNLLFLCENCAAETKALLAHFPNKLTRIVNGSRVKGKINNWQCVCVSVIELVLVICCCAKFGLTREKSAYDWTSPRLMASIEAGFGRMSRQAWLRQQQRWRRRRRRQRLRW